MPAPPGLGSAGDEDWTSRDGWKFPPPQACSWRMWQGRGDDSHTMLLLLSQSPAEPRCAAAQLGQADVVVELPPPLRQWAKHQRQAGEGRRGEVPLSTKGEERRVFHLL